jgi:Carboxypeptidase regulatory-like domain
MRDTVLSAVKWLLCMLLCLGAVRHSFAQDTNASLTGTVTDPNGAAIPRVSLTLTNEVTLFKVNFVTNDAGEFNFANIPPGKYDLSATAEGFKSVTQKGIELAVTQQGRVNVQLPLGNIEQNVTVSGETSQINFVDPTIGGGIAPETLQDFPLTVSGAPRSSVTVADMLPGVSTGASGNAYNTRINGGLVSGDEALVDGATAMEGYMNQSGMVSLETDFGMSPDITSEVHVLTANYDAQYGNSTSGQLIIVTRSGGDQFHGAAYEYLRNDALNARQWGTPLTTPKPEDKENDFGANLGGPILIPGLHGPSSFLKGYFYFNWEGFKEAGGANSATLSIPSLAARNGNFSGAGSQIYYPNDLSKYGADAGQPVAFGGVMNQINPAYEDPVAKAWMTALPTPTNNGEVNNYFIPKAGQGSLTANENVYFGRVDMNIGRMDHVFWTTWWQRSGLNTQTNLPVAVSTASPANPENANIQRLNWEHNFSGNMTNHATIGYLNRNEAYFALNGHAQLPTVPGVANATFLPRFNFGGGYTQLGNSSAPNPGQTKTTRGTWAFNDVFTRIIGSHTINAGFEWRFAGTSIHLGTNQGGTFTFNPDTTGNQGCPSAAPCPGDAAASFYLGAVSTSSVEYYNVLAEYPRQDAWALHAGDSWRITPRLTIDYSLRWDYIQPFREKYNNLSFFDPNGLNPGAVRADGTQLKGRLAFAGNGFGSASYGAPYPEIPFKKAFAPRVGFAYTLNDKTVVRAGYGIYFGQAFYPGWSGGMSQDGFNKNVTFNETSLGNLKVPALYLNSGISPDRVGQTKNISSSFDNGQTPSLYRPLDGNRRPYSSQWNLTIERQLPQSFTATVSYVGTQGTHLPSTNSPINVLNPNDTAITRLGSDLAVNYSSTTGPATFAAHGVNVPYTNWQTQMTGCAPTLAHALVPYPQFCGTLQGLNEQHATSSYHSLQIGVNHRAKNGLFVLGSFTFSKLMTNSAYSTQAGNSVAVGNSGLFSPYNITSRNYALAPDNVPISAQVSVVYDLPFGLNQRFLNRGGAVNVFAGGWQVSPLYHFEFGTPLWFTSSSCPTNSLVPEFRQSCIPGILPGHNPYLHSRNGFDPRTNGGRLLDPTAFETNFSQFGYTGFGSAVSNLYGPKYQNTDIAFTKNTKITERANFKFMANFFNAFNNHYFVSQGNGPALPFVTDVAASGNSFGTWNGTVSNPRTIQLAGRIEF